MTYYGLGKRKVKAKLNLKFVQSFKNKEVGCIKCGASLLRCKNMCARCYYAQEDKIAHARKLAKERYERFKLSKRKKK